MKLDLILSGRQCDRKHFVEEVKFEVDLWRLSELGLVSNDDELGNLNPTFV